MSRVKRKQAVNECKKFPSPELIKYTLEIWQPRSSRQLTEEDARQIIMNTVSFFRTLQDWKLDEIRTTSNDTPCDS